MKTRTTRSVWILWGVGMLLWIFSNIAAITPGISNSIPTSVLSPEEHLLWGMKLPVRQLGRKEWEMFPGIGPATAEKIMTWQKTNGPIENIQELDKIPGIGPKTIQNLSPHLSFF